MKASALSYLHHVLLIYFLLLRTAGATIHLYGTESPLLHLACPLLISEYVCRPSFEEINERLDGIIIDSAIQDELGRVFWKEDDSLREHLLPWPTFSRKLWRFLGLDVPHDPDDPLPPPQSAQTKEDEKNKWYLTHRVLPN